MTSILRSVDQHTETPLVGVSGGDSKTLLKIPPKLKLIKIKFTL